MIDRDLNKVEAFIFNSSSHWFAIRKINDIWFNINSTNSYPGPEIISDFYLSAFIQGTEDIGYTNFLIKNVPSLPDLDTYYTNLQSFQRLVPFEDIIKAKEAKKNKHTTNIDSKKEEEEDKSKFKAFGGKGYVLEDSNVSHPVKHTMDLSDPEMKQAYELSLQEFLINLRLNLPVQPAEDDTTAYNIKFVINEKSFSRRFNQSNRINVFVY